MINDVDELKKENEELRKLVIKSRHRSYNIELRNDKMENISWWAVLISFIVSYAVGFAILINMCPSADMSVKVSVCVGLWFSTWVSYYFSWRFDNKREY